MTTPYVPAADDTALIEHRRIKDSCERMAHVLTRGGVKLHHMSSNESAIANFNFYHLSVDLRFTDNLEACSLLIRQQEQQTQR